MTYHGCGTSFQKYHNSDYDRSFLVHETKDLIIPVIRLLRERADFSVEGYQSALSDMFSACSFKKYKPIFVLNPDLETRGEYDPTGKRKKIALKRLGDLKAFLLLWYYYIDDRKFGFVRKSVQEYSKTIQTGKGYVKDVMAESKPNHIRGFDRRVFFDFSEF